jgi:hypothetical protein
MGGKLSLWNRKERRKREGTQTRRHPGMYPTGSVRKTCNEYLAYYLLQPLMLLTY